MSSFRRVSRGSGMDYMGWLFYAGTPAKMKLYESLYLRIYKYIRKAQAEFFRIFLRIGILLSCRIIGEEIFIRFYPDIANLAMIDFATYPEYPFRASDGTHTARKKMNLQLHLKALASILQGLLPVQDIFGDGSTRQKPFQFLFHFRDSAQKVSKLKSENKIRPNPLFFRNSRYFPSPNSSFKHHCLYVVVFYPQKKPPVSAAFGKI